MAVDAAWGAGKTTFLKMWARHLRNEGFPVVEFNAWETDFAGDPFVALSSEITEGLSEWDSPTVADKVKDAKDAAQKVLRWVAPGAIRLASGFIPVVGTEFGKAAGDYAAELLTDYPKAQQSVKEFKSELEKLAAALWESSEHKPLVVFIDELDRCRPSYAIELLETGKHIFSVDHVVFVLAVNRAELAKSVKVLYGDEFDAEGYLKRFFDIDFVLPAPDRKRYIDGLIHAVGIENYLSRTTDRATLVAGRDALEVIRTFFGQDDLSLRTVGQAIHRFGLVLSSLSNEETGFIRTLAVLAVLSAVDPDVYQGVKGGDATDRQLVQQLFDRPHYASVRRSPGGAFVEAVIIASKVDRRAFHPAYSRGPSEGQLQSQAPLFGEYEGIADSPYPEELSEREVWEHAHNVYQAIVRFYDFRMQRNDSLGLDMSVQRFELVSAGLLRDA